MVPRLTEEQRKAVENHDGCVEVEDARGKCVLMSMQVFREVMGIGTQREFEDSVAAIRSSYEQFRDGRVRALSDALDDLGNRYGLSR